MKISNELRLEKKAETINERTYEDLEIVVISFESEDVITASGGNESPWDTD